MSYYNGYSPDIARKIREAEPIEDVAMREAPAYMEAHKVAGTGVCMKNPENPRNNKNACTAKNALGCFTFWGEKTGDVIYMVSVFRNCSYIEAYHYLREYYGFPTTENKEFTEWTSKNQNNIEQWHKNLFKPENIKVLENLHKRKITDEFIKENKIGYCERGYYQGITIPIPDKGGQTTYFARRYFDSKTGETSKDNVAKYIKAKTFNSAIDSAKERVKEAKEKGNRPRKQDIKLSEAQYIDFNENIIWGYHTLNTADPDKQETLIIAEGAFDAFSFAQEKYPVISPLTCNFSEKQIDEVFRIAKQFNKVVLTLDNDSSGQRGNHKLAKAFIERGISFDVAILPKRKNYEELIAEGNNDLYYKDVSEYYEDYGEVEGILNNPLNMKGLIYEARLNTSSENKIKKFILSVYRKVSKSECLELIQYLNENRKNFKFSEIFIKELEELVKHAPPEAIVAEEVLAEHDLIFTNKRFYEYQNNQWNKISETTIEKYVGEKLGRFKKHTLEKNIKGVIKAEVVSDTVEFNENRIIVFEDGTLNLDTFKFNSSHREDYNTFKANYSFEKDSEINCPIFDKFIDDITGGDKDKKRVILEYMAYGFFPDQRFKKFLYLLGDGDNGKSILTQLIADLFCGTGGADGRGNIAKVDYDSFSSDFERMHLKGKLFNFCSEITKDTKGKEPILKAITGGDYITGAYKGIDSVAFICNAKLIFTGNTLPVTRDKVEAYYNRFIIVKLPIAFVPDPKGTNEKLADPDISEKLRTERPSIIKKLIQVAKELEEQGKFTEVEDSKNLLLEYKEISNPILQFFNEVIDDIVSRMTKGHCSETFTYMDFFGCNRIDISYLDFNDNKKSNEIITFTTDIYKLYRYYAEFSGYTVMNMGTFSEKFEDLLIKNDIGKKINRGRRGFVLYKDKIAEREGFKLSEDKESLINLETIQHAEELKENGFQLMA